ncbi:sensor histidine kinase KdpD [Christensenella sp. NSJ-35]|uniref:Sensor histidine kinase KdpD n=1 Tax=Christensenella tenuis TaxID=2763033 RepID=A0ABR7EHN2_9FIRM|nr:sensor histidine kinase KdpD [Christensenella tenuis]MBC5648549.1 sensor histidine kinase KdpD [Christensenella tenuis]
MYDENERPNPDELLRQIGTEETPDRTGKLKIFFGYSAGVGKTYTMLRAAHDCLESGIDVVVGYIEPHTRAETMKLVEGLPVLPTKKVGYKNIVLNEFDLDGALARHPQLILVDELAHTNAPGVRNKKRYQDVEELLNAGIDVYTTVNVQHLASLNDIIKDITHIEVRETIPDYIFDKADSVALVDIEPEELLKRFEEGKIYRPERVVTAMNNFFTRQNLSTLREISMRRTADRIYGRDGKAMEKSVSEKLLVLLSPSPSSAKNLRVGARMAEAYHAKWEALYVETRTKLTPEQGKLLRDNMNLAEQLGAEVVTMYGENLAEVVAAHANLTGVTNVIIGKTRNKKHLKDFFKEDFEDQLIGLLKNAELHIIPDSDNAGTKYKKPPRQGSRKDFGLLEQRTQILYEISKKLLATRGLMNIISGMNEYISRILERSVIFYLPDMNKPGVFWQAEFDEDASFLLGDDEKAVAKWVLLNKKRAGAGTDTLMGAGAFYMPIMSQGAVLGVMGVSCKKGLLSQDQRMLLRMIASQVAMALERQRLSDEQLKYNLELQREKLKEDWMKNRE